MTIKEFCQQYNKSEANVRAKINHNKEKLDGHITKSPYTKTIMLDEFAINFLLNDQRGKLHSQDINEKAAAPMAAPTVKVGVDTYQHWSGQKKERVMAVCMQEVRKRYCALRYIPDEFKTYELCRCAVESQGLALEFVPICYVTEELCNIAVNENSIALAFVPDEFKTRTMIHTAFDNYKDCRKKVKGSMTMVEVDVETHLLKYVPEKFLDKDVCLKALSKYSSNAQYIPRKNFDDEIIAAALKDSVSRKCIPKEYWTRANVVETIKTYKHGMYGIPRECFDYELYMQLIDNKLIKPQDIYGDDYYSGILTPAEIGNIREIDVKEHEFHDELYALIQKDSNNIRLVSVDDEQYGLYALIAIAKCGEALKYIPMEKRNYDLCEAAVMDNSNAMLYVPDEFKEQIINTIKKRPDWLRFVFDDGYFSDMLI